MLPILIRPLALANANAPSSLEAVNHFYPPDAGFPIKGLNANGWIVVVVRAKNASDGISKILS